MPVCFKPSMQSVHNERQWGQKAEKRTIPDDVEVVVDGGECGANLVYDGAHDGAFGYWTRHLLCHLVEAGVVPMPPHVPAMSTAQRRHC